MYNKGLQKLRNLDSVLASIRQEALQDSRATSQDIRRSIIREDVRRQQASRTRCELTQDGSPNTHDAHCKSIGVADDAPLPSWYEGEFLPMHPPSRHSSQCVDEHPQRRAKTHAETDGEGTVVAEDVAQRVAQAERTLYPTLLAVVADYTCEAMGEASVVIERDANGAPQRLFSAHSPEDTSGPTSASPSAPSALVWDGLYESPAGSDALRAALLATPSPQPTRGKGVTRLRALPAPPRRPLCAEGTAVAKSTAGSIARDIRRAVLEGKWQSTCTSEGHGTSPCRSPLVSSQQREGRSSSVQVCHDAPKEALNGTPEMTFTRVLRALTAEFCTYCGTCAARDLSTGEPKSCPQCGAAYPETTPLQESSSTEIPTAEPPESSQGSVKNTATVTTKSTMAVGTESIRHECGVGTIDSKVASTQAESDATHALKNFSQVTEGLYFLHLWDQTIGQSPS